MSDVLAPLMTRYEKAIWKCVAVSLSAALVCAAIWRCCVRNDGDLFLALSLIVATSLTALVCSGIALTSAYRAWRIARVGYAAATTRLYIAVAAAVCFCVVPALWVSRMVWIFFH
jgi:hypothetical protein